MDERLGLCAGCLRTLEEIACWSQMSDTDKRLVLAHVSERRVALGELPINSEGRSA